MISCPILKQQIWFHLYIAEQFHLIILLLARQELIFRALLRRVSLRTFPCSPRLFLTLKAIKIETSILIWTNLVTNTRVKAALILQIIKWTCFFQVNFSILVASMVTHCLALLFLDLISLILITGVLMKKVLHITTMSSMKTLISIN